MTDTTVTSRSTQIHQKNSVNKVGVAFLVPVSHQSREEDQKEFKAQIFTQLTRLLIEVQQTLYRIQMIGLLK